MSLIKLNKIINLVKIQSNSIKFGFLIKWKFNQIKLDDKFG